ncbi:MAG: hypothetical protein AAFV07_15415, partial [Bacteroidota bacterium]
MSRYKVHIDKPLPDKAQIAKFKNFDEVHARYQTHTRFQVWQNLYRNPRAFAALVAIVAVIFLVVRPEDTLENQIAPRLTLKGQEMAFSQTSFPNETGINWALNQTESIEIPAYAFVDSQGQPVEGPVHVRWTALQDPAAIFLQAPATTQPLERLMQLTAYQGDTPLFLKEGIAIQWTLPTDEAYGNWMAWDEGAEAWTRGAIQLTDAPVAVATAPEASEELLALRSAWQREGGTKALPAMPQRPQRPFGVKLKRPEAHPEFRNYAQTYWTYLPGSSSNDPWAAGLVGADRPPQEVRIQKLSADQYRLQFVRMDASGDMEIIPVLASPVFKARTATDAQRIYRDQLATWERERNQVEAKISQRAKLKADWEAAETSFAEAQEAFENQSDSAILPRTNMQLPTLRSASVAPSGSDSVSIVFEADSLPQHIWAVDQSGQRLIPLKWEEDQTYLSPVAVESLAAFWAVADSQTLWLATPNGLGQPQQPVTLKLDVQKRAVKDYTEAL